jgi:4'-phosphopantetheinyl transferase EntD
MPLYKTYTAAGDTQVLVWKITETLEELSLGTVLKDVCSARLHDMKSEQHRKGFLSVRKLLEHAGYTDLDMYYGIDGKPHLKDGKNISITHSYNFSAIIISGKNAGIDMEMQREKIITIANKFCISEFSYLNPMHLETYMRYLTVIWGVKEALFKMISLPGISFKQHINVFPFSLTDENGKAEVTFNGLNRKYIFFFKEVEGFTLVYSFEEAEALNH